MTGQRQFPPLVQVGSTLGSRRYTVAGEAIAAQPTLIAKVNVYETCRMVEVVVCLRKMVEVVVYLGKMVEVAVCLGSPRLRGDLRCRAKAYKLRESTAYKVMAPGKLIVL